MLRNIKDMENFSIRATDGTIGHVMDFLFDDEKWAIRYLVVDTGTWLSSRKVLISPIAIGRPEGPEKVLPVLVTKAQVKASPDIDAEKPVSRQHEMSYIAYYGYQDYWSGGALWGAVPYPFMMRETRPSVSSDAAQGTAAPGEEGDPHLRSCSVVTTYNVEANDGDIGHVQGLLVEEDTWAIRYIVVETSHWWSGHLVLIVPEWIRHVSWAENTVAVNLRRQAVKGAPPYDSAAELDRMLEMDIYKHYGRNGYWAEHEEPEFMVSKR